ncbi:MAG: hypothetical protein WA322_20445, partial [Pseudolabrys sp.]
GALMSASVTLGLYASHLEAFQTILATEPKRYEPEDARTRKYRQMLERKDALYDALNERGIYSMFNEVFTH